VSYDLKIPVFKQWKDIFLGAGKEIIDTNHIMTKIKQVLAEVRSEQTGTAGDQYSFLS